ncbi:cystathionine beta-lyase [Litorimonas haliclonae]|uniref:cystathionine beta-lyase n=1 Tax=Litorimonas haliclonae TaxID=2081977 RepID=UPI0039F06F28
MKKETEFTHLARPKAGLGTAVNPSVTRASTLLFSDAADLYRSDVRGYGRHGGDVHDQLCDMFTHLEGGAGTTLFPSGLMACTIPIMSQVKSGDHVLLTDSAYGPTRGFCLQMLTGMGVSVDIYDPHIGAKIKDLIQENTRLIILESPGSLTFEIQDIPAITKAAKEKGVKTLIDNTWAAGIVLSPLSLGVDISCHAATKYFGGHSDIMFGAAVSADEQTAQQVSKAAKLLGNSSSPDDAYQILRGFRSIMPRFRQQEATALTLAHWLVDRQEIQTVLHPALESHPDHELWKRDFTGSGCLFSVVAQRTTAKKVEAFINALSLFGVGYSYGGFESLAIQCDPQLRRSEGEKFPGPLIRFACGLEHVDDLREDIEQALTKLH